MITIPQEIVSAIAGLLVIALTRLLNKYLPDRTQAPAPTPVTAPPVTAGTLPPEPPTNPEP